MTKHTFNYCATHKADEAYMQAMCARGWAATRLVEGFWTFEPCQPGQYCYRICYLRGKSKQEADALKQQYAALGIEFVSRYSFWAIFRSARPFELYTAEEELEICKKMYTPMPVGAAVSWILCAASLMMAGAGRPFAPVCLISGVLLGLYGAMCTWLAFSYHKLLRQLQ